MANDVSKTILAAKSVELKFQLRAKGPHPLTPSSKSAHPPSTHWCQAKSWQRRKSKTLRGPGSFQSGPGLEIRASHATANGSTHTVPPTKTHTHTQVHSYTQGQTNTDE